MKVQTHIKAGDTLEDWGQSAQNALSSAAQTVSNAASGLAQGASDLAQNLGVSEVATKLWYWPFQPPSTPSA
ncbi:MAG: hypothetical protein KIT87_04680 [Anaerolineae bacterium]|nr:hypothetical protein [Anaerolineae bacterium]